jgi:hypothetical protein
MLYRNLWTRTLVRAGVMSGAADWPTCRSEDEECKGGFDDSKTLLSKVKYHFVYIFEARLIDFAIQLSAVAL